MALLEHSRATRRPRQLFARRLESVDELLAAMALLGDRPQGEEQQREHAQSTRRVGHVYKLQAPGPDHLWHMDQDKAEGDGRDSRPPRQVAEHLRKNRELQELVGGMQKEERHP